MCVNSSCPTSRVRSVYGTGRAWLPQAASDTTRTTLVHVDRLAVRDRGVEVRRDPHRDANAAMTCRVRRNGRIAVDRIATGEVHRVVEGAERTGVEADDFAVDREPPDRRVRPAEARSRDRDDQDDTSRAHDVQDLPALVDLQMVARTGITGNRATGICKDAPEADVDHAGSRKALNLLERLDGVQHPTVERPSGRRSVVEQAQTPSELSNGRSARAEREPWQDDVRPHDPHGACIESVRHHLDANAIARQPSRVEREPGASLEASIDEHISAARDLHRKSAGSCRDDPSREDVAAAARAAAREAGADDARSLLTK